MERLLLSYLMIIILGIHPDALGEKPMLIPSDSELVIQQGNELRIECYSNLQTPLHFSYPEYTIMSPRSTHEIQYAENGTLTFLRRSAVSLDTGWYACAAKSIEIENDFETLNHTHENISWIYVYVSSSEPFADHYYTFPKTIIVLAESPGIVPCRPTLPDLDIELSKNFRIIDPNDRLSFDPKIGFIVEPPSSEDFEAIFHCKVKGIEDVYVLRYSNATGRRPRMNASGDTLILQKGDELRIECYGGTNIQFAFPEPYENSYTGALKPSSHKFSSEEEGKRTFIRSAVVPGDTGWYGCAEEGINPDIPPFYLDYTKKEINWIYVYVESETYPLLGGTSFLDSSIFNTISAIVPCRPTSPKFNVTLKSKFEVVKLDENVQFHPKLGFLIRRDLRPRETCYECLIHGDSSGAPTCFSPTSAISPHPQIESDFSPLTPTEDLRLSCRTDASSAKIIFLEWNTPAPKKRVECSLKRSFGQIDIYGRFVQRFEIILTVENAREKDSGLYSCMLRDAEHEKESSVTIAIHEYRSIDKIMSVIPGSDANAYALVGLLGQRIKWMLDKPPSLSDMNIMWYTPSNTLIRYSSSTERNKYKLQGPANSDRVVFEISNLTFSDAGLYRVVISQFGVDTTINITLEIQAPPTVTMAGGSEAHYTAPGETLEINFTISGSPRPNVTCSFAISQPHEDSSSMIPWNPEDNFDEHEFKQVAALEMSTNISGDLTCRACNLYNCSSGSKPIYVTDDIRNLTIIGPEENAYEGDDVVMTCAAPTFAFQNLSWNDGVNKCYKSVDRDMFYIEENRTKYTIRRVLHIKNVMGCHQRLYFCWGKTLEGDIVNSSYHLHVRTPEKPRFTRNNMNGSKITSISKSVAIKTISLYCCVDGDPSPSISWFEDNVQIKESPVHKVSSLDCQLNVTLNYLPDKDGRYTCKAQNRFGEIEDYVYFVAEGGDGQNGNLLIVIISSILVFIVLLVASLVIRKYRRKIANERLKEAILRRFDEGELNRLDSTLDIVDQAEILPYDKEWEYPRKMLKLGKVLGSGAFGIVRRAEAKSIRPGERVTTVAVKMVRPTSTLHHMMALSRELKILVHLGQHLNIVNLLGACTKNVSYGELLVIVEFCRFGNLRDYLSRRRADFIDQVDPITGEINAPDLSTDRIDVDDDDANTNSDVVSGNWRSADSSDDNVATDGGIVPGLRSEYRGDDTDGTMGPIRTKDLLSWAWQVSRGMRYLGVRRVVHGDLAARNILLADNNVIKICDFGLAKALYKVDHYKNAGGDPLPLKWLAIETITDLRFSIESDVWSFGIVLWEFFSLGKSPYPGINVRDVYKRLLEGYRMDKPKYAPKNIYRLMMNCWQAEPANRPSFAEIETVVHGLLDDSVKTYYMDMSNQYTEINAGIFANGKKDYLTMYPLRNETVSFSVEQEEVEFSNIQSNESPEPLDPEDTTETVNEITS